MYNWLAQSYLADEFHGQSSDVEACPLSSSSLVVRRTRLSSDDDRTFPVSGGPLNSRGPAVEHSAAEGHVGAVTDCFMQDSSLQSFFPRISSCARAVTSSFRTLLKTIRKSICTRIGSQIHAITKIRTGNQFNG